MDCLKLFNLAKIPIIAAIVVGIIAMALDVYGFDFGLGSLIPNALALIVILLVIWAGYTVAKANGELIDTAKVGALLGLIIGVIYRLGVEMIFMRQADSVNPYSFDPGNTIFYIVLFIVLGAIAGVIGGFIPKLTKK